MAPQLSKQKAAKRVFLGHEVNLDDPIEIVTKKIFHRGGQYLPRDLFDLATVYNYGSKTELINELLNIKAKAVQFFSRLEKASHEQYSEIFEDMLLPGGREIKGKELYICRQIAEVFQQCLK